MSEPARPSAPAGTPREGGLFYGWVVVAATFVVLFFGFGTAYSFGTFFEHLERDFGATRAAVSLVFSVAAFLLFSLGAAFGPLADRFGARWLAAAGMVVAGSGLIIASRATSLWQVDLAYGLGIGLGVGMAYVPAVGAVQKWFVRRRGLASGLAVAGIGFGTLCTPMIADALIGWGGWRGAFLVMGVTTVIGGGGAALGAAVRSRPFVLIYAAYFLVSLANFVPLVHLVPYAQDHGIATETGVVLLGLIGLGSTLGRFVIGAAADRFGLQRSLAAAFAGIGLSCLWWLASTQAWQLALFAVWMGTCYGGFVALGPAVMAEYFGARNVSGITGVLYSGVGISTLAGAPLAGLAFDVTGSYALPIAASGIAALASGALVFRAPAPAAWQAARQAA